LSSAVASCGKKWERVALQVNESFPSVNKDQCQKRWAGYLNPELADRVKGPWTLEQVYICYLTIVEIRCITVDFFDRTQN
jgi:hypothetical protein